MMSFSLSRSASAEILTQLRALRASITQARDALLHFHADRLDRDRLEPAARRVDDLLTLFASGKRDPAQGSIWVAEIQSGVDRMTNPKSAETLQAARVNIIALLEAMRPDTTEPVSDGRSAPPPG